jgi:L-cystine transport system permease protein
VFTMYLSAAFLYWIMSSALAWLQGRLEARAGRHVQRARG